MESLKIIKIGGEVINNDKLLLKFIHDFSSISGRKIMVHGGGKSVSSLSHKIGIIPTMKEGRRVTDADTLMLAVMVYSGWINKRIVAGLQKHFCQAIGLCGADFNTILANKRSAVPHDYGYVGDVEQVNSNWIIQLIESGIIPVFSAITHDGKGQLLNTNADTIAASLASALVNQYETSLYLTFEHQGVLADPEEPDSLVPHLNPNGYKKLSDNGAISGGMIPKLDNGFSALQQGVNKVIITSVNGLTSQQNMHTELVLS